MATRACKETLLGLPLDAFRSLTTRAAAKAALPMLRRYMGKGVTKAVENINKHIGPALVVRALRSVACMRANPADTVQASRSLQSSLPCHYESRWP